MIGNFGQGLAIIDPAQDSFRSVSLPASPVSFYFTHDGSGLVVLTADSVVRLVNPATGQALGGVAAVAPVRTGMPAPPAPRMIVGERFAYVTDPITGEVVEVDLANMTLGRKMRVGGMPSNIAVIVLEGAALSPAIASQTSYTSPTHRHSAAVQCGGRGGIPMKVVVDPDRCEGHGRCEAAAPEVFQLGDDDQSHVLIERPGEELRAKVERAVRLCPRQAISIVEDK